MADRDATKPVTPRPAASVVLLRHGDGRLASGPRRRDGSQGEALEVLLLQRSPDASFFPAAWVFPGGSVEPEDGAGPAGYRACAVRELREEAGIELPTGQELVPFCRWITPEVVPRRFDAWFFLALAPAATPARIDGGEIVDARWLAPAAALAGADAGEIGLAFPTRVQLGWLAEHTTSDAALAAYRGGSPQPLQPEVIGEGDDVRVVLPGVGERGLRGLAEEIRRD